MVHLRMMAALCLCAAALSAEVRPVSLRWADLPALLEHKTVEAKTAAGAVRKGRVALVDANEIRFEGKGAPVTRAEIAEIRLIEYVGNARRFGRNLGGLTGLMIGLISAAVIGLKEDSSNLQRNKVLAGIVGVAGLPAGMLIGHMLSRAADREVTLIRIIPEPPGAVP